jgi:hypothetical protein
MISHIIIKDFNIFRNPLNFMVSVLIMVLSSLNSKSLMNFARNSQISIASHTIMAKVISDY